MRRTRAALVALVLLGTCVSPPSGAQQQWGTWSPGRGAFGDWHWASPVADDAALQAITGAAGECRAVMDTGAACCWSGDTSSWLCGGGGSVNSFETVNASSGTDPVADSATDTLSITGGTGITVTGDSATDTLTIASTGVSDHGALTGLGDDDHTQYALLAGRAGGQTLNGGSASGKSLSLFANSAEQAAGPGFFLNGGDLVLDQFGTDARAPAIIINGPNYGDAPNSIYSFADLFWIASTGGTGLSRINLNGSTATLQGEDFAVLKGGAGAFVRTWATGKFEVYWHGNDSTLTGDETTGDLTLAGGNFVGALTGNASTATALAADPADCPAGQWAAGIAASGAASGCTADDDAPDSDAEVPDTITASSYAPLAGATFTGVVAIDNAQGFKLFEADANGSNFFQLTVAASLTGDVTCAIGADGKIPDSCVGDGTDGGGAPGGSNTHVQFNDSSAFGGDAGLTYNKTTDDLAVAGHLGVGGAVDSNQLKVTGSASITSTTTIGGVINASSSGMNVGGGVSLISESWGLKLGADATHPVAVNGGLLVGTAASGETYPVGTSTQRGGNFSAAGDAQAVIFVARRSTTNATPAELFLDGSSTRMTLANDTTWAFSCQVVARRTDADGESAGYTLVGVIDRQTNAASTALVGTVTTTVLAEDTAAWDVAATADTTNGALILTVTGQASKTIRWVANCSTVETTG